MLVVLSYPIYGNLLQHPRLTKMVQGALEFGTDWRMLKPRGVGSWFQGEVKELVSNTLDFLRTLGNLGRNWE